MNLSTIFPSSCRYGSEILNYWPPMQPHAHADALSTSNWSQFLFLRCATSLLISVVPPSLVCVYDPNFSLVTCVKYGAAYAREDVERALHGLTSPSIRMPYAKIRTMCVRAYRNDFLYSDHLLSSFSLKLGCEWLQDDSTKEKRIQIAL